MTTATDPPPVAGVRHTIHIFHQAFRAGGGMEQHAIELASAFRALGHQVVFHTRVADEALGRRLGIEMRVEPIPSFPRSLRDYRFFRRVNRLRPQLEGFQIALTRLMVRDAAVCGGTHRGYLSRARKLKGPFDWLQIWMERQCYSFARVIVAHSRLIAGDLQRFYQIPASKILTLYPPVGERFSPADAPGQRDDIRRRLGLPADKFVFLFPSLGHTRKGLTPICQALREFQDEVVLAVAGKPPSGRPQPFVRFLGFLEDMVPAYRAADFSILGSYYEPFGLVGPESILCGTRLVFEENMGCLAAIKPEFVTTFSVWNPASIRQAITAALALARPGRHRISEPAAALAYDPSPAAHARAVLRAVSEVGR